MKSLVKLFGKWTSEYIQYDWNRIGLLILKIVNLFSLKVISFFVQIGDVDKIYTQTWIQKHEPVYSVLKY